MALSCGSNLDLLERQVKEFQPRYVSVKSEVAELAKEKLSERVEIFSGEEGLSKLSSLKEVDTVLNSLVGFVGLKPTLKAARNGKKILLANKESLVIGGGLVTEELGKERKDRLIPIDSEHSAIKQCIRSGEKKEISRLIITASGGSFRDWPLEDIESAGPEQALNHPNWSMGNRITCDSASMVNKAFEVIEAHWLFDIPYKKIDTLIHHQSVIHSMVEFCDGSVMAQLGPPDMKGPIQYALTHPKRLKNNFHSLDLLETNELTFERIDKKRYPAFYTLLKAGKEGGNKPAALNAADEQLINYFMEGKIDFGGIARGLKAVYDRTDFTKNSGFSELRKIDRWARKEVKNMVQTGNLN